MANSDFLRKNKNQHSIKNSISKVMDNDVASSMRSLIKRLNTKYPELTFDHESRMMLSHVIDHIGSNYPQHKDRLAKVMETSFIKPDGGFLYATNKHGLKKLILVAEVKRQGTNDKRASEGLQKQARGNAIERLGKNLIGIRGIFKKETIIPFVCFGSGDDFSNESSILDRVITMNDFFPLGELYIRKNHLPFEPVSMMFRYELWSANEMTNVMERIADVAILHYFGTRSRSRISLISKGAP